MAQRTFLISDTHFFHRKIMEYENRPFQTREEMNAAMIKRWNQVVKKNDMVIHLGDVAFAGKIATKEILSQLNGYKRLIMGNHDRDRSRVWWLDAGFDEVSEEPILYKGFYLLSHEPIYVNAHMPYINVHGHIHGHKYEDKHYFNACVEHWNYTPFNFDLVIEAGKEILKEEEA